MKFIFSVFISIFEGICPIRKYSNVFSSIVQDKQPIPVNRWLQQVLIRIAAVCSRFHTWGQVQGLSYNILKTPYTLFLIYRQILNWSNPLNFWDLTPNLTDIFLLLHRSDCCNGDSLLSLYMPCIFWVNFNCSFKVLNSIFVFLKTVHKHSCIIVSLI